MSNVNVIVFFVSGDHQPWRNRHWSSQVVGSCHCTPHHRIHGVWKKIVLLQFILTFTDTHRSNVSLYNIARIFCVAYSWSEASIAHFLIGDHWAWWNHHASSRGRSRPHAALPTRGGSHVPADACSSETTSGSSLDFESRCVAERSGRYCETSCFVAWKFRMRINFVVARIRFVIKVQTEYYC